MKLLPFRRGETDGREASDRRRAEAAGEASAAAATVQPTVTSVEPDLTGAAFFDVDNTMMMGSSMFHISRGLAARKFFTTRDLGRFAWRQAVFRIGGSEPAGYLAEARKAALAFAAGWHVDEVVRLGEEIYDEIMAERIWPGTRALAQNHLAQGQRVWLVTATPVELASIIANRLGLTGALGSVAEHKDGVYTGELIGELLHGPAKAAAIRALAEREGLDLSRCTAYSDSANDIPMLSLVGTAVAINPDPELRRVAKEQGWQIRDYRSGRKALRIGLPTAAAAGAVGGAVSTGLALRRRRTGSGRLL
ncbi:HAD-IB family hydrolase [Acidothermaceae bacterium B102]|nr:HAD-IB family hydrolase [Acidothermaceae bacterium B102]